MQFIEKKEKDTESLTKNLDYGQQELKSKRGKAIEIS